MARPGSILDQVTKSSANQTLAGQGLWSETNPSVGDTIAQAISGGRDMPRRVFYNSTRAGLFNDNTPPDDARPLGGLGRSFKDRRFQDMFDAQKISDEVPHPGSYK